MIASVMVEREAFNLSTVTNCTQVKPYYSWTCSKHFQLLANQHSMYAQIFSDLVADDATDLSKV